MATPATVESPAVPASPDLLNFSKAASALGLSIWQVRGLVADNAFPVVRVGKRLYVRRATLTKWAERAEAKYRTQPRGGAQ